MVMVERVIVLSIVYSGTRPAPQEEGVVIRATISAREGHRQLGGAISLLRTNTP